MTLGGRYDAAEDDAFNPVNSVTTITDADAFTGRIGTVYLFDNGLAPYASCSESFQPATGTYEFFTLHLGSFGGMPVRWGYFLLGLAGEFVLFG